MRRSPSAPSKPSSPSPKILAKAGSGVLLPPVAIQVITRQQLHDESGNAESIWLDLLRKYPSPGEGGMMIDAAAGTPRSEEAASPGEFGETRGSEFEGFQIGSDTDREATPVTPGSRGKRRKPAEAPKAPEPVQELRNTWLLQTVASDTGLHNRRMAEMASSPIWRDQKVKEAEPPKVAPEQEMERQIQGLASGIDKIRKRHETFVPGQTEDEGLAAKSSKAQLINGLTPEEARERFELLKFVRKIEPELPPLQRAAPGEEVKEPEPDSTLIRHNCSQRALKAQLPKAKVKAIKNRNTGNAVHAQGVVDVRSDLFEEKMRRRKEQVLRTQSRGVSAQDIYDRTREMQVAVFMKVWMAGAWLLRMRDEVRLRKMHFKDRMKLVEKTDKITKTMKGSALIEEAENLRDCLDDPVFHHYKDLLKCVFSKKIKVKYARQDARAMYKGVNAWKCWGQLATRMKYIQGAVRRIQGFWRFCSRKLSRNLKKVDAAWVILETEDLMEIMRKEDEGRSKLTRSKGVENAESRLKLRMISDNVRITFLENELRSRRLRVLPQIKAYDEECRKWREEMRNAQEAAKVMKKADDQIRRQLRRARNRTAQLVVTKADDSDEDDEEKKNKEETQEHKDDVEERTRRLMLFRWPPSRGPSYLPSREDIMDMLHRCRLNPRGWLPMPVLGGHGANKSTVQKGSKGVPRRGSLQAAAVQINKSAFTDAANMKAAGGNGRRTSLTAMATVTAAALQQRPAYQAAPEPMDDDSACSDEDDEEIDKVDEDLEQLGLRPSQMPGGLARPPSPLPE